MKFHAMIELKRMRGTRVMSLYCHVRVRSRALAAGALVLLWPSCGQVFHDIED